MTFKEAYNKLIQESGANQQKVSEWAGVMHASSLNRLIGSDISLSKMSKLLAVFGYTLMISNGQNMYSIGPNTGEKRTYVKKKSV